MSRRVRETPSTHLPTHPSTHSPTDPFMTEATAFHQNPDGSISLVADAETVYLTIATLDCQTRSAAEVR
ncbi:MAG: hypothetical protein IGS48_07940 [Oscillatoriales cyanobacterium C42_A2020_001]|nr:hypothetical protein [Leptolyngbyaceae cyanobacterium C42_A2020_001]